MNNVLFNTNDVADRPDFEPVPAGDYLVQVQNVEFGETANGYPKVSTPLEIISGEHAGRLIFQNFILAHSNPQVVEIAQRDMKELLSVAGFQGDVTQQVVESLAGFEFMVSVTVKPRKDTGEPEQVIRKRYPAGTPPMPASMTGRPQAPAAPAGHTPQATAAQAPQAPATPAKRPWE